ncbi:MAG: carboxypeptidase regulatory-like domain-containing protein [Thermoflexales bacterium]|nr:carboxypeptidase regulatory-like domain-containing protein [Thermoflexales bacterium]
MNPKQRWNRTLYRAVSLVCIASMLASSMPVMPPRPAYASANPTPASTLPEQSQAGGDSAHLSSPDQPLIQGPPGVRVNLFNGNVHYSRLDLLSSPGGYPFPVLYSRLSYNSLLSNQERGFGRGWRFGYDIYYTRSDNRQIVIHWADGREESYVADGNGGFSPPAGVHNRLVQASSNAYRLHTPDGSVYYFDSERHRSLTRLTAANRLALSFTYDGDGRLTTVQDDYGRTLRLDYSGGRATRITNDFLGQSLALGYDGDGRLRTISDPAGQVIAYDYERRTIGTEKLDLLSWVTLPGGQTYVFSYRLDYPAYGLADLRVSSIAGSYGAWNFSYTFRRTIPVLGGVGAWNNVMSRAPELAYASVTRTVGDQTRRTRYDFRQGSLHVTDPLGNVTRYKQDTNKNLIAVANARGYTSTFSYDGQGHLSSFTDPLLNTTRFAYDARFSQVTAVTDALGNAIQAVYDGRGNMTRLVLPDASAYTAAYDANSQLVSLTTPLGYTFRYGYDGVGRLRVVTDSLGYTTALAFDAQGNLLSMTDPNGDTARIEYDALGQPVTLTDGLGRQTSFAYDAIGNTLVLTDPNGHAYHYAYNERGQVSHVIDPLNNTTRYTYDAAGQLTAVRDAAGRVTTFEYDALGRLVKETDPLNRATTYVYDLAGNVTRRTDARGQITTYAYDPANRLTAVDYPGAGSDEQYTYDALGNVVTHRGGSATLNLEYNAFSQLTRQAVSVQDKSVSYAYDALGQRTAMTDTQGSVTRYEYDARGQLERIVGPAGTTFYAYDPAGRRIRQGNANGTFVTYAYDRAGQLVTMTNHLANGDILSSYAYEYDAAGNRTRVSDAGGSVTAYSYDPLNRLVQVTYPGGRQVSYTYDATGNRLAEIDPTSGATTFTYDAAGQLTRMQTPTQTIAYTYDDNGNLASKQDASGVTTYDYDYENRLRAITYPGGAAQSFSYYPGPDGLRLSRTEAGGQASYYFYDEQNLLLETDASGGAVARYTAGLGPDEWIAMQRGGSTYTYLRDGLGSVTGLADPAQNVAATYQYDAFGQLVGQTGSVANPYRFTGRAYEPASGLYDYRARFYDPAAGRFLSRDPSPGYLLFPVTLNPYAYVANNPASYVDPSGRFAILAIVGIGIAVYGLAKWAKGTYEGVKDVYSKYNDQVQKRERFIDAMKNDDIPNMIKNHQDWQSSVLNTAGTAAALSGNIPGTLPSGGPAWSSLGDAYVAGTLTAMQTDGDLTPYGQMLYNQDGSQGYNGSGYGPGGSGTGSRPGFDRPSFFGGRGSGDDTFSAASPQFPAAGATGLLPSSGFQASQLDSPQLPVYRHVPRIALLWNGHAQEAGAFLNALGEPYDMLEPDFSPAIAALYPVLFIPDGGLFGLENSASFRARLEQYAARGGIVLVSAQEHGYEYAALPTPSGLPLDGYGWAEDVSCTGASTYFSQYHQAISGSRQQLYLSAFIDGYLSAFPDETVTLLTRDKNGYPAALLYPYQQGFVMISHLYAPWGMSFYQVTRDDLRTWRDMIAWSALGGLPGYSHSISPTLTFPDFSPGQTVSVTLRVQNASGQDAAGVRLVLINPDKEIVEQEVVSVTLGVGMTATLPFSATAPGTNPFDWTDWHKSTGVWAVDYVLLGAGGEALQEQAIGAAFVVSDPPEGIGRQRNWDLWVTAPTNRWTVGETGDFTFYLRNRSGQERSNAQVHYWFRSHLQATGDPAYDQVYPLGAVAAAQTVSFSVQATVLMADLALACLEEDGVRQICTPGYFFSPNPAAARVSVQLAQSSYYVGQPVTASVSLVNAETASYTATARLRALSPLGAVYDEQEQAFALGGRGTSASLVYTLAMPLTPTFGLHTVRVEVLRDELVVGGGLASFELPLPHVPVTVLDPSAYRLDQANAVSFRLDNQGGTDVVDGTFSVRLEAPDSQVVWSTSEPLELPGWESVTFTHAIPFSTTLGVYTLHYDAHVRGYLITRGSHKVAAAYAVARVTDKDRYSGGETMAVDVVVQNTGDLSETLDVRLEAPGAPFSQTQAATPGPGQTAELRYQVPLTTAITAGVHPMTVSVIVTGLANGAGPSSARLFQYIVLPARLRLSLPPGSGLQAGGRLPLQVTNVGGGLSAYAGQLFLRDSSGRVIAWGAAAGSLDSGEADTYELALPSDLREGLYNLGATYVAHATGQQVSLNRLVAIHGVEAELSAATAWQVYTAGEAITATARLTNTGAFSLGHGTLVLEGISMLGFGPLAGVVLDNTGRRLAGARVTLDEKRATWTNRTGEYFFESVGVGEHHFQVEAAPRGGLAGYLAYSSTQFVLGPQEPLTLTLYPAPTAELSGTLRASGGVTIVVGADVEISGPASGRSKGYVTVQPHLRTGGDGAYHFSHLEPGNYTLTVTAPGFQAHVTNITLGAGVNTHDVDLVPHSRKASRIPYSVLRSTSSEPGAGHSASSLRIASRTSRPPGLASLLPARLRRSPAADVGGTIVTPTTWTLANSPYTLTADVIVTRGVTLTIEPGVVVRGQSNSGLKVQGYLAAMGTPTQPITFTSSADSGPYQWQGLLFDGGLAGGELRHAVVRYGGRHDGVTYSNITVRNVLTGQVRIESSQVVSAHYSLVNYGLYVQDSRVVVSGTLFADNGYDTADYALYATGASTAITVANSAFVGNPGYALALPLDDLGRATGNTFSGNGRDRVVIWGGALAAEASLAPQSGLESYELGSDVVVSKGITLTVQPGVTVMGRANVELKMLGHLAAVGTPGQPITFTSSTDSGPNQWSGLIFDGGLAGGRLRHAVVRYGGNPNSLSPGGNRGVGIWVHDVLTGQVRIESSQVLSASQANTDYGLYVEDSRVVISDTLFAGNGSGATDTALYAAGPDTSIVVANSAFRDNAGRPMSVQAGDLPGVLRGNTFSGNGVNRLQLRGDGDKPAILADITLPNDNGLDGYELYDTVWVEQGVTLTVLPGTGLYPSDYFDGLSVHGHLRALGTPTQPITYAMIVGGPGKGILVEGAGSHAELQHVIIDSAYTSDGGVTLKSGATAHLKAVQVSNSLNCHGLYAMDSTVAVEDSRFVGGNWGGIDAYNARLVLTNTAVISNGWDGIDVSGAHLWGQGLEIANNGRVSSGDGLSANNSSVVTLTRSSVHGNSQYGIYAGSYGSPSRVTVRHSRVYGNGDYQVREMNYDERVDVRYNWWGTSSPTPTLFSSGYGQVITTPWLISSTFAPGYFELAGDVYEPNERFAQATPLAGANTALAAFLEPRGDADVYRLEVDEEGELLALADGAGTLLELNLSLYDASESRLASATAASGGEISAAAHVVPGLYYVRLAAGGDVPSSRSPYHLTLLLLDPRTDLVAQTVAQAGRSYEFGAFPVNLAPGASTALGATAPLSLAVPGGYYLRARLVNSLGQALGESTSAFFLSDNPLALTLQAGQPAYRPGQDVTVSGQVRNTGAVAIGPQTLELARNGVAFHTEPLTLPAGGVHAFSVTTTAPSATGAFTLSGQIGATAVTAILPVVEPVVDASLDAPDVQISTLDAQRSTLTLANNGLVAAALGVDFHGQPYTPTLQPGELAVYSRALLFTQTTAVLVHITGDVTRTLLHTVSVSAAPALSLGAGNPQREGDVEIAYTLANSGTLDMVGQVEFQISNFKFQIANCKSQILRRQGIAWVTPQEITLAGRQYPTREPQSAIHNAQYIVTRTHTLPAGAVLTDTLVISLARGLRPVQARLRIDEAHNPGLFSHSQGTAWEQTQMLTLTVRGEDDLRLAAFGAPTVTVAITNVGWNAFSGTLRAVGRQASAQSSLIFASLEQPIQVPTETARTFSVTLDTSGLNPGPYTITLEAWAGNGARAAAAAITGSVPGPEFVVAQVPTSTTLLSDRIVTLTFGVENRGKAPDLAALHFAVGSLEDAVKKQWVVAGQTALFTYTFYVPLDMPSMDVYATYAVTSPLDPQGDAGDMVFHVDGISLTVEASTDRPSYVEGEPLSVTLSITNADSRRGSGELRALVAFNMITHTRVFSLAPGAQVALTFPYTATFQADRKIFYGLYGQQNDRGAYLDTLYLYRHDLGATLELDKQVYRPGETVRAALVTTLTQGTLTPHVLAESYPSLALGSDSVFTFSLPADLARGSYAIYSTIHGCSCEADGREQVTWFDVAAPLIQVIRSDLSPGPYRPGDVLSATLTIACNDEMDAELQAWLGYPDGSYGAVFTQAVHLASRLDNRRLVSSTITGTQMGLHRLFYRLVPPGSGQGWTPPAREVKDRFPAELTERFDVGPAGLGRVATELASYAAATDMVQVVLDVYSQAGGPAQLVVTLDDGLVTTRSLSLAEGYQLVVVPLSGAISPGARQLTATLTMSDREGRSYWAAGQADFVYGDSLPDLYAGTPLAAPGGTITRTLASVVANEGQSAATATTARFYDGTPLTGTLIGAAAVPALDVGETAAVSVVWDVQGQGGKHTLSVAVEPVGEFDETDNEAQSIVSLPRLDSSLEVAPALVEAGKAVTLTSRLKNLQGAAALPVTVAVEIRSPQGSVVHSQAWTRVLSGAQELALGDAWQSGAGAVAGTYAVLQQVWDAYGEHDVSGASFTITAQPGYRIYLPLVIRS